MVTNSAFPPTSSPWFGKRIPIGARYLTGEPVIGNLSCPRSLGPRAPFRGDWYLLAWPFTSTPRETRGVPGLKSPPTATSSPASALRRAAIWTYLIISPLSAFSPSPGGTYTPINLNTCWWTCLKRSSWTYPLSAGGVRAYSGVPRAFETRSITPPLPSPAGGGGGISSVAQAVAQLL